MKLLSHLSPDGDKLPQPADSRLLALGFEAWEQAVSAAPDDAAAHAARDWSALPIGRRLLAAIFGNSPFLSGVAVKEWRFLTRLVEEGADPLFDEIAIETEKPDDLGEDTAALMRRLRIAKRRVALLARWQKSPAPGRSNNRPAPLSRFAEAALGAALRHLLRQAAAKSMVLPDASDPEHESGLIVLGMGKLGGGELNYSSDIDLILLYDPARARVMARDGVQPFFIRLARDLVRLLDERTGDGYVFRTDLRLRPDPALDPAGDVGRGRAGLLRERRPELGTGGPDQSASGGRRPRCRPAVSARAAALICGASTSISRRSKTSTRSSARSTPTAAAGGSPSTATTSRSAAAASARSSSSPRRSS